MNTQNEIDDFIVKLAMMAIDSEIKSRETTEPIRISDYKFASGMCCFFSKLAKDCGLRASFENDGSEIAKVLNTATAKTSEHDYPCITIKGDICIAVFFKDSENAITIFLERGGDGNFFRWNVTERPLFKTPQEAADWLKVNWRKIYTR